MKIDAITIRPAHIGDDRGLADLAALDSAEHPPPAPLLVGEVDGVLRAALSLADGTVVADPFYATGRLVELMRTAAAPKRRRRYPFSIGTPTMFPHSVHDPS